jgi:hypothetical protein
MKSLSLFLLIVSPFYLFSQQIGKYYYGGYVFKIGLNQFQCIEYFNEPRLYSYYLYYVSDAFVILDDCNFLLCKTITGHTQGLDFDIVNGKRVDKSTFYYKRDTVMICSIQQYQTLNGILRGGDESYLGFMKGYREYLSNAQYGFYLNTDMKTIEGDFYSLNYITYENTKKAFYYYGSKNFKDIEAMKPLLFQYLGRNGYLYFFTDDGGVVIFDKNW